MKPTIDVHAHILPDIYLKAMKSAGMTGSAGQLIADGFPVPAWSVQDTLRCMDKHAIAATVLSISSPGVSFLPIEDGRRLVRDLNEELAAIAEAHPKKFAKVAILPLPDVDASLREIKFAFDIKGFDGVGLFSNFEGRYLGDPLFDPVMKELNERAAVVFIHPVQPPGFEKLGLGLPAPILEFPFDSTRMLTNLIRSGALARYDRLKIIVPHGGGAIPYLEARIARSVGRFPGTGPAVPTEAAARQLRSVYYDLTAMGQDANLRMLQQFVPAERLLVGHDYPYMTEATIAPHIATFNAFDGWSEDEKDLIRTKNAIKLFPSLA